MTLKILSCFLLISSQGPPKVYGALREDILEFIKQAQERVLSHQEEQALLKAYIAEWRKFFTQCSYLPMPFGQLETALQVAKNATIEGSIIDWRGYIKSNNDRVFMNDIVYIINFRARLRPMFPKKLRRTNQWLES